MATSTQRQANRQSYTPYRYSPSPASNDLPAAAPSQFTAYNPATMQEGRRPQHRQSLPPSLQQGRNRAISAPSEPALPPGWTSGFDETRGRIYYVDLTTGKPQWRRPQRPQSQCPPSQSPPLQQQTQRAPRPPKPNGPLPSGWTAAYDERRNAWYYCNAQTRVSQWARPQTNPSGIDEKILLPASSSRSSFPPLSSAAGNCASGPTPAKKKFPCILVPGLETKELDMFKVGRIYSPSPGKPVEVDENAAGDIPSRYPSLVSPTSRAKSNRFADATAEADLRPPETTRHARSASDPVPALLKKTTTAAYKPYNPYVSNAAARKSMPPGPASPYIPFRPEYARTAPALGRSETPVVVVTSPTTPARAGPPSPVSSLSSISTVRTTTPPSSPPPPIPTQTGGAGGGDADEGADEDSPPSSPASSVSTPRAATPRLLPDLYSTPPSAAPPAPPLPPKIPLDAIAPAVDDGAGRKPEGALYSPAELSQVFELYIKSQSSSPSPQTPTAATTTTSVTLERFIHELESQESRSNLEKEGGGDDSRSPSPPPPPPPLPPRSPSVVSSVYGREPSAAETLQLIAQLKRTLTYRDEFTPEIAEDETSEAGSHVLARSETQYTDAVSEVGGYAANSYTELIGEAREWERIDGLA